MSHTVEFQTKQDEMSIMAVQRDCGGRLGDGRGCGKEYYTVLLVGQVHRAPPVSSFSCLTVNGEGDSRLVDVTVVWHGRQIII